MATIPQAGDPCPNGCVIRDRTDTGRVPERLTEALPGSGDGELTCHSCWNGWNTTRPRDQEIIMPIATQDPGTMPAAVHGEEVVSAFRHLPLYGRTDDTYTVITLAQYGTPSLPRYNVFRARFAPALGRWSIDTVYPVRNGLPWNDATRIFAGLITAGVS